jgi:hypothetical protein
MLRRLSRNTALLTASCQQVSIDFVRALFVATSHGILARC